ncbi:ATP-dependent RNA helicase dbp6 [Fusarium torreyae]|uniref:ATP-dependent RNA helicase n=1 Tax=Fusarium torreyae TaxID=1237075 RepID=A0A9W8VQ02_9HYPO|nr:ATP-dependent RNA helicase dbp6 [Fusarium torreyae]
MYARYVPPPKGGKTLNSAPSAPSPSVTTNSAPATNAFSYSRYVPPSAKPAPQPAEVPQVQYFDDEPTPFKSKRKRDSTEEARNSPQPDSKKSKTVEPSSTTQKDGEEAPKKKKKVRRGKRRTGATNDDDDDEPAQKPPKDKSEPQKAEQQEKPVNEVQEESQTLDEDSRKDKKQKNKDKKKEKKEKKKKPEVPDTPLPEDEDRNEDVSMADAAEPVEEVKDVPEPADPVITEAEKKEKRREKKKKHKELEQTEEAEDKEENNKHKMVMERLEKSLKLAGETVQDEDDEDDQGELHGLEPLPQPAPISLTTSKPSYETLPPWLAEPIRVSQDTRTPFAELGILPKASRALEGKGFRDAFAVQTAAIPLLLPTSKQRPGDVLISAATGSGKTLAYALPVVRDLSQGAVTRLRALVVLPTRELVKQAQEAFELCAKAFEGGDRKRVRVGISIGSQSLKHEQEVLMDREVRYDPEAYKKLQEENQRQKQQKLGLSATDSLDDLDVDDANPRLSTMNDYVVDFPSKVDVLICTPGRLVEHMEQTPGFNIDYVRWLVVDEADKLLAQSFQGWLDVVMENFRVNKFSARDFPDMDFSGVRKVILSATLTRDLSLLNQLGLQRPRLIVLESDGDVQIAEHSLPALLKEHAIRVHDTNLKPLYLLDLLQSQDMLMASPSRDQEVPKANEAEESDTSSDSSSSSDSDSDSDPDATSDTSSDLDSDSETETKLKPSGRSLKSHVPVSLIFTKSNESALRLSRLLALLDPSLASHIGTLTSTTPTHIRRKTLRAFTESTSPIRLLIASDLVARGIDLPNLDHVINYDLPPSVAGYVHRVGRTARAGRPGCAWTLVGDDESGWFWGKIAKGAGVKRAQKMERTRIEEIDEARVEEYEAALEKLGKEAGR